MGLKICVMAPDGTLWDQEVEKLGLSTTTGEITILPGHAPLITVLKIGVLRIKLKDQGWQPLIALGGVAYINSESGYDALVLLNGSEEIERGKLSEATAALKEAEEKVKQTLTDKEKISAVQNLERAYARVQAFKFVET